MPPETPDAPEHAAAHFAATLTLDAVPEAVCEQAKAVIADSFATIIGGATTNAPNAFAELCHERSAGEATILGTEATSTRERAALANGSAGTVLELDEGHKFSAGHPAMHVLPAVLAETELSEASGETLLTAFIAGYEVAARTGMAAQPLDLSYHMHGLWGTVGAAAAVARVRGHDTSLVKRAMRIGANHALHTRFETATEGATVRNTYAGMSNMNGLLAVDQAEAGFTGLDQGIERHLARTTTEEFDSSVLADELGTRWEVTRGYFKRHSACRYTHGALDALERIRTRATLTPDDCRKIVVETYESAAELDDPHPENTLDARFSIPFAVATALVHGSTDKQAFSPSAITDETRSVAERVSVDVDDEIQSNVPDIRATRVTIETASGQTYVEQVDYPEGDRENPLDTADHEDKIRELTRPVLGERRAANLRQAIADLPATAPSELTRLGRP